MIIIEKSDANIRQKEDIMNTIYNVYIIWAGGEREFKNVTDIHYGEHHISFTEGDKHRFFSDVPFEVEEYHTENQ